MREILFRGKRLDNGEWVSGAFVPDALEALRGIEGMDGFIRRYNPNIRKTVMYEVDRETVGQFTGLTDKNGVKIFEGDIVRYTTIDNFVCRSVVKIGGYQQDGSCGEYPPEPCYGTYVEVNAFACLRGCEYITPRFDDYERQKNLLEVAASCKVIGNVHDAPNCCNPTSARTSET